MTFLDFTPQTRTKKLRDGSVIRNRRTPQLWAVCIEAHRGVLHEGRRDPNCAACQSMEQDARRDGLEI